MFLQLTFDGQSEKKRIRLSFTMKCVTNKMPREIICIPDAGHTLASILRSTLFKHGATFASCIVQHPEDTFLKIEIETENSCKEVLRSSLVEAKTLLENYKKQIENAMVHEELQ